MSILGDNFKQVIERMERACQRAGRLKDAVELLAVSKRQPPAAIERALACGQRRFGENYAQELRDKAEALKAFEDIEWHAIGALQTNKAKYVSQFAHTFHALDRLDLAEELSRRRKGHRLNCYVEVNLADEPSKGGIQSDELPAFLKSIGHLEQLNIIGLMCLPPLGESPEQSRPHFQKLKDLSTQLGLLRLSMGTTFDFEVAIEEGATCVRVGTALFGERL